MWDTHHEKEWYRYLYLLASAELAIRSDKPAHAEKFLEECPLGFRRWEWSFLRRRCSRKVFHLMLPDRIYAIAFSPDGRKFITAGEVDSLGVLRVWDYQAKACLRTIEEQESSFHSATFSPDGKYIAAGLIKSGEEGRSCEIRVWEALTDQQVWRFRGGRGWGDQIAFSPSGRMLAAADWDGGVDCWDMDTGEKTLELGGHSSKAFSVAFSADGRYLASAGGCPGHEGQTIIWEVETGKRVNDKWCMGSAVSSIAYCPGGQRIASPCGSDILIWEPATGRELIKLRGHADGVYTVLWHPDGQRLVTASADDTVKVWDPERYDVVLTFESRQQHVSPMAFSPQGTALAIRQGDANVEIWDATPVGDQLGQMRFA
jgi:WD40 repeat protein